MLDKTFENFELKLVKLREESREDFEVAEKVFDERYESRLEEIFPRDVLGAKKHIAGMFLMSYVNGLHSGESIDTGELFKKSVDYVVATLPLNSEKKESLSQNIFQISELSQSLHSYFAKKDDISRDPFFALVEDFSMDGDISKEEFLLLQQSYDKQGDFLKALDVLPDTMRHMFHSHIALTLSQQNNSKRSEFEGEFSQELKDLKNKGINIESVIIFASRSYYKTPGKLKRYENPKRRMRRTFKIALLKLLRTKLGNIDATIMLKRFEQGESFEDLFMLLYKLLDVVAENPEGKEIFKLLDLNEDIQDEVFSAEENKQKILSGESLVMSIASLFSKADASSEEQELGDGMLEKILDESTDLVGDDVYFNRPEDENAGIFTGEDNEDLEEADEEELDYDAMSPETAYEILKRDFHRVEEEKRKAFLEGKYDDIDVYNDNLLGIQSKLEKLTKLLGEEL